MKMTAWKWLRMISRLRLELSIQKTAAVQAKEVIRNLTGRNENQRLARLTIRLGGNKKVIRKK